VRAGRARRENTALVRAVSQNSTARGARGRRSFQASSGSEPMLHRAGSKPGTEIQLRRTACRGTSPGIPRKEVIQPQLPLRLPCYDFTPITNPTFDGSLPCGLGHRLRVLPAFVV
jgi:hypothetical protein